LRRFATARTEKAVSTRIDDAKVLKGMVMDVGSGGSHEHLVDEDLRRLGAKADLLQMQGFPAQ
jgi:hypothetical protein